MCTVSWLHQTGGYQLFCNRDEKLTRRRAEPPRLQTRGGVSFLAPIDRDFGGTWIATNEFGVSVCLLNGENRGGTATLLRPVTSRGLLLLELAAAKSAAGVCACISASDLSAFAPFTLAVLEPDRDTMVVEWNGVEQVEVPNGESRLPLTSSSFDAEGVRTMRLQEYLLMVSSRQPDEHALLAFHRSHGARPSAYSTCMHREDAETVSFSWIKVRDSAAEFFYSPAAPCRQVPGETTTLPLRRQVSE